MPALLDQCRVVVNAKEAYLWQGSGVKYYTQSLLRAVGTSDLDLGILVETYNNSHQSALADTSALQIHHYVRETSLSRLRDMLSVRFRPLLRPWGTEYIAHLVSRLDPLLPQIESALQLCPVGKGKPSSADLNVYQAYRVFSRAQCMFALHRRLLIIQPSHPRKQEKLIYHNPMPFPIFMRGAKNVVTIHDTIALTHPELCLSDPGLEFSLISQLLRCCDAVHAISEHTAESLCSLFGSDIERKLYIIPQANPQFEQRDRLAQAQIAEQKTIILKHFLETGEGYLLQLGTIEPKKNHLTMLEAFKVLRQVYPKLRLVVVGKPGWLCDDTIQALGAAGVDGVDWKGSVPRASLEYYMANALALVFPSLVEGWGLPPLEAMTQGTPTVVSAIPACIEACGDAAQLVHQYQDPLYWVKAIRQILDQTTIYQEMVSAALARSQMFQPADFARDIRKMYASLL
jgi:glycosyltransferase involved in cell wall biosynthesis